MRIPILGHFLFQSILFCGSISIPALTEAAAPTIAINPTDLPTYPNLWKAAVTGGGKGIATLYEGATHDTYETVLAWYRSRLVGATEQKSGYLKDLMTFKLQHGESVTVYRSEDGTLITLAMNAR